MEQAFAQVVVADLTEAQAEVANANEKSLRLLIDAELLCIGGGSGDVVLG